MLASLADAPLDDPQLVYEPKYDGIRAIAEVSASRVRLWSRLGNDKTPQFPEIARALETWAKRRTEPVVLDGEIVALDAAGHPTGFQHLQGRIHLSSAHAVEGAGRVAFVAFDLLRSGPDDLRGRPLVERRAALEKVFGRTGSTSLRISEIAHGDGRALHQRAVAQGWEGLIAKRATSRYRSGKRTADWRKLKIVHEQEFVIGGWTEPRQTRAHFGALLIGVHEDGLKGKGQRAQGKGTRAKGKGPRAKGKGTTGQGLVYAGHVGTGFDARELARLMRLLKPLATPECPFTTTPASNERAHWVTPSLVAQVRFSEWTTEGRLRHPVYLGLRDDKKAVSVHREEDPNQTVLDRLHELEHMRRDGVIDLPGGHHLKVTNLHKVFWPALKLTKGDLLRYYVRVAPYILPAVADRPLVMKRFPNGIDGQPFYQHRAVDVPPGVRVEVAHVGAEASDASAVPQMIGGNLTTLLYMAQLAAISQDPWFSRISTPEYADYVALDLDPPEGVAFARVLDVARWIHDELEAIGAVGVPKTSGADGLHIYIPLPKGTPYEAGRLFCQIIATLVSEKHPKAATVERRVKARGQRIYIDCLQNIAGKTLATAYSARASAYAGVSAPLTWREVEEGVRREDFTITTMPGRIAQVGDLWAPLRASKGVNLARLVS